MERLLRFNDQAWGRRWKTTQETNLSLDVPNVLRLSEIGLGERLSASGRVREDVERFLIEPDGVLGCDVCNFEGRPTRFA